MSDLSANNLSKQRIQQLLAAVGSRPVDDNAQIQTTDYNWHQPHYFNHEQLKKLDDMAKKLATTTTEKFTCLCQSNFNTTITSITQLFSAELLKQGPDEQQDYFLTFETDKTHPCGAVGMPCQTAAAWAKYLLGDSETEGDSDKDLSQLEVSLLSDIGCGIIEALSDSHEAFNFHPANNFTKGQLALQLKGSEELCKITFNVKKADSENESAAYLLILCSELDTAAGKTASAGGPNALPPKEISKTIQQHIERIHVNVTAQLASTFLTFDQILNLQVDDIFLLGKRVDEPIEVMVDGRKVCHGWPAKSSGQYAVVFTEKLK